jgi:AcrR family transcriptional regulator
MSFCSDFILANGEAMAGRKKISGTPRKLPAQDRSRATVTVILDAAARILVKDGYRGFTTNRVAEKAGVSIGSLYQYFPNKEALIGELQRRHVEDLQRAIEEMAARPTSAPIAEVIRGAVEGAIKSHLVDPPLHRVLSEDVPLTDELDWEAEFKERATRLVRQAFDGRRNEIVVGDLDLAVYVVMRAVEATVHDAVFHRQAEVKSGALAEEVTRMVVSYLTGKPLAAARKTRALAAE